MSNIIASNLCYGTGSANNWTSNLSEVSLAYTNSIIYLKFSFDQSISYCDELKVKIIDNQTGIHAGIETFNICISVFNNDEYINLYSNSNIYPSHDNIIYRDYTTYTKNAENEYTIPTSKMINTGAGTEYIMMIGTYDNSYGTNAILTVSNTIVEGIKATRTIIYDMNTGDGDPIEIAVYKGETITVIDTVPEKAGNIITTSFEIKGVDNYAESLSGSSITAYKKDCTFYRFLGWDNNANAIRPKYDSTSEIIMFNNIRLYAIWEEYTNIIYENNKLSEVPIPSREKIETSYIVTLDPNNGNDKFTIHAGTITEYLFKGWVTTGQGTEIINMDSEYFENTVVYALWETVFTDNSNIYLPIPPVPDPFIVDNHTISLQPNGGTLSIDNTDIISKKKISHIFDYWSTSLTENIPVDLYYTPTEDITLYAIYKSNSVILPVELPIATKSGYIFAGWTEDNESKINVINPYMPSQDITLYANFISKNKLKMHIYHNGKWHHIIM